ncbi:hypothetical protein [Saccharopolyspora sp. CA-218241]|uniref:hypothetical protein n=1 Tax=Saccharopolyspora sp. CA-218241 TaxID=3240027 RepID=UPI003D98E7C6
MTPYAPTSTAAVLSALEAEPERLAHLDDTWPELAAALVAPQRGHHRDLPARAVAR